jgi:hypothetical protein
VTIPNQAFLTELPCFILSFLTNSRSLCFSVSRNLQFGQVLSILFTLTSPQQSYFAVLTRYFRSGLVFAAYGTACSHSEFSISVEQIRTIIMKNAVKASLLVGALAAQPVYADLISDAYVGSDDHGYGDVISNNADRTKFDITGAEASLTGSFLNLSIQTNFVNHVGIYPNLTKDGLGVTLGDLFLASEWNPAGSASDGYKLDNHANGTIWQYGLVLNDRSSNNGGIASLYQLTGATNDANAILTEDVMSSGGIFRDGQETLVDLGNETAISTGISGSWSIDSTNNVLNFGVDLAGTSLLFGNEIAFHWNMTCGNDTIEGAVDVPEPATLGLLGLSLVAMFGLRRRNQKDGESA